MFKQDFKNLIQSKIPWLNFFEAIMLTVPLIIGLLVIKEKPKYPPSYKAVT